MQKCKYGVAQSISLTEQDGQIFPNICQRRGGYVLPPENAKTVTKRNIFYSMNRGFLCWGFANVGEFSIILPIWYVYITQLTATAFSRFLIILVMFMCLLRLA